ncbi:MAG TPA: DUF1236 domain-containing protein [Xanthobacteraceae bacterium]|nr:DUF1236 domain-containing protein [Xanthobacteraceae bacterium]
MRKHALLANVAALSLLGATSFAVAQGMSQGGQPAAAAKPEASPAAKEPAAKQQPAEKQTNAPAAPGVKPGRAAQDQKAMPKQAQDQKAPEHAQDKPAANSQTKSATDPKTDAKVDTKTSTTGSAPGGKAAAAPPPEKRSQIAAAIKQEKITETTNVNFNVSIGTRVPSTVTFYPIPTRIIDIYPEWSGYQVILVNGRYVVVRPQTYEIVYIIEG